MGRSVNKFTSSNIAQAIAEVLVKYPMTQIVICESQRSSWEIFIKGSVIKKLVRLLKNIDLHIIATGKN